ncbi:MAG: ATP-binding protein [Lachnospiraceae bacterium]|nr:ATP-binding protein [Lachnospiraceae bacterium]
METYLRRTLEGQLQQKLRTMGAVNIRGPKWCGKSTTARQYAASVVEMQNPSTRQRDAMIARADMTGFLDREVPFLIDEWQEIPFVWDGIRYACDQRGKPGQFLLTGSVTPPEQVPEENEIRHSGIGRISSLVMRTMTLHESGDSTGKVSLRKLFDEGIIPVASSERTLRDMAYLLCRGGWPGGIGLSREDALLIPNEYYEGLVNADISRADGVKKDPQRVERMMRAYARHISTQATITTIKSDMAANETDTLDEDTIRTYINALKRLYVIEDLAAWNPNIRSKTAIRTADTRHFTDASIACAALGIGPEDLMNDPETFGLLFESMCIRDLRVYTEALNGKVYHYRDASGLEADAVLHLRDGRWAAVEIKLENPAGIEEGASHLRKLADRIDVSKMKKPSFLMIVTATDVAYRREDGIYVTPLSVLGP